MAVEANRASGKLQDEDIAPKSIGMDQINSIKITDEEEVQVQKRMSDIISSQYNTKAEPNELEQMNEQLINQSQEQNTEILDKTEAQFTELSPQQEPKFATIEEVNNSPGRVQQSDPTPVMKEADNNQKSVEPLEPVLGPDQISKNFGRKSSGFNSGQKELKDELEPVMGPESIYMKKNEEQSKFKSNAGQ